MAKLLYVTYAILLMFSCKNIKENNQVRDITEIEKGTPESSNFHYPDFNISRDDFTDQLDSLSKVISNEPYNELIKTWNKDGINMNQEYAHHLRKDLKEFSKIMLTINGGIDSIQYQSNNAKITLFASNNDEYPNQDFSNKRKALHFDGEYYKYHDIYYSLFSFVQVNIISVYNTSTNSFETNLPSNWDMRTSLECNEMKKAWYVPNINYHSILPADVVECKEINLYMKKNTDSLKKE